MHYLKELKFLGIFVFLCVLVNLFLLLKKFNTPITVFSKTVENTIPPVVRGLPNDLWADLEVGRRDFGEISAREVVPFKVQRPGGVIVDRSVSPGRLYVWDSGNNRILGIDLGACYAASPPCSANIVIGQPSANDFGSCNQDASFANYPNRKPASANTLCGVSEMTHTVLEDKTLTGMYIDTEGNLYVADMYNHRVLKYIKPFETDTVADEVWGQPDFSGNGCNIGGSINHLFPIPPPTASSLCFFANPSGGGGVSLGNEGNLWVADGGNNRVLRFSKNSSTGIIAKTADIVLGQPDFTTGGNYSNGDSINRMSNPTSLTFDPQGNLYVSDLGNNRILVFEPPFTNGMPASRTFGSSFSGIINVQNDPENRGIWTLDNGASVARLLDYDGTLKTMLPAVGAPGGVSVGIDKDDNVIIATYSQEDVVVFQKNQDQSYSVKQRLFSPPPGANLASGRRLDPVGLGGVGVFGSQLIVSDGRLLFWNDYLSVSNGASPSGYIADQNFPKAADPPFIILKVDSIGHVWVGRSIMNNISKTKIEVYQAPLTSSSTPIKVIQGEIPVLGQTEKLRNLEVFGLAPSPDSKYLWVGDPTNNRVFRIRDPLVDPKVDIILGQIRVVNNETIQDGLPGSDKDPSRYNLCNRGEIQNGVNPSLDMLCLPGAISLDRLGNLFISDHTIEIAGNFRLLMFKKELFPEELTSVLFAPKASKEFPNIAYTATYTTFEPAFDSVNRMVVGNNPYRYRFVTYFNDPTKINPNNPSDLQYALPDGQLNDFYNWPVAATFDTNDNLIVFDANRGQARIYLHPFPNPPPPTPTETSVPTETPTPIQSNTPTPSDTPILTLTPTPTATPIQEPTPTVTPTVTASPTVTPTPTVRPTSTPTIRPTSTPTKAPTATPTITPIPTVIPGSLILGYNIKGSKVDRYDSNWLNASKFTMPNNNGTVVSLSVFVDKVDTNAANRKYQVAIYEDAGGKPGTLVATSAVGVLSASAWNTIALTATLRANTTYWLAYNTNGRSSTVNNLRYNLTSVSTEAYSVSSYTFGSWPAQFPSVNIVPNRAFSIYATYAPLQAARIFK